MLRTRQSIPLARLKLMLPALNVRPRLTLRLSSIAASVAGGIRIPCAASPWPCRPTETASCTLGLPLYRTMKRVIKRPVKLSETANHSEPARKPLIPRRFPLVRVHAWAAKEGCPRHATRHDGADLPVKTQKRPKGDI